MMFSKKNLSICMLAIWLVVLQALSPFVHAHFEPESHTDQANGLHLHSISFKAASDRVGLGQHQLVEDDSDLNAHIVTIEKGLIQKFEILDVTAALITFFIFFVIQTISAQLRPQKQFNVSPIYKRGYLIPRAPPHY